MDDELSDLKARVEKLERLERIVAELLKHLGLELKKAEEKEKA